MTDLPNLRVAQVFVPGKLPEYTYNPRAELHLEESIEDYVDETGTILAVAGPTKTGKSVLLRRTISNPVWCDGGQGIDSVEALWALIADELGLYTSYAISQGSNSSDGASFTATAGVNHVVQATGSAEARFDQAQTSDLTRSVARPLVSVIRDAISGSGRGIVIDDFHFIDRSVQKSIVRAIKPLVLKGVPIAVGSISHRVRDVILAEPDMTGRVTALDIPFWSEPDLLYIAREGFGVLGLEDPGERIAKILARESYGSPHLMQKFCRELCKINGIREQQSVPFELRFPGDWQEFFVKQVEPVSQEWLERLLSGPKERGSQRTQWKMKKGGTLDGYGLMLRAIAESGPRLDLSKDEIRTLVGRLVDGSGPAVHQTTRYLQRMSRIAATRRSDPLPSEEDLSVDGAEPNPASDVQPVLEYVDDDPHSRLHIADPFFAFCLRWGAPDYLGNELPEIG